MRRVGWFRETQVREEGEVNFGVLKIVSSFLIFDVVFCHGALMATHFRDDTPIATVADGCSAIAGTFTNDPQTQQLAPVWEGLTAKADGLLAARRAAERTLTRARNKLVVMDSLWDPEIAAFARDVLDQSGGKRDQSPNTRFFKTVTSSEAQDFGVEREVKQGRDWLLELGRDPNEPLAVKWIPRLTTVTDNLDGAVGDRRQALQAMALQDTAEELFIDAVNREIDITEGDLLKLFPGQPKRIAAYLAATRPATRRTSRDPDTTGANI